MCLTTWSDVSLICRSRPSDLHLSSCKTWDDVLATVAWLERRPPQPPLLDRFGLIFLIRCDTRGFITFLNLLVRIMNHHANDPMSNCWTGFRGWLIAGPVPQSGVERAGPSGHATNADRNVEPADVRRTFSGTFAPEHAPSRMLRNSVQHHDVPDSMMMNRFTPVSAPCETNMPTGDNPPVDDVEMAAHAGDAPPRGLDTVATDLLKALEYRCGSYGT